MITADTHEMVLRATRFLFPDCVKCGVRLVSITQCAPLKLSSGQMRLVHREQCPTDPESSRFLPGQGYTESEGSEP